MEKEKPFKNFTLGMFRQYFTELHRSSVPTVELQEMFEQACPLFNEEQKVKKHAQNCEKDEIVTTKNGGFLKPCNCGSEDTAEKKDTNDIAFIAHCFCCGVVREFSADKKSYTCPVCKVVYDFSPTAKYKSEPSQDSDWAKDFDEEFTGLWLDGMHDYETDVTYTETETIEKLKAFISKVEQQAIAKGREEMKQLCKKVYMEGADWSEWGMTEEEAEEDFEEELKALTNPNK